ncbi:MAG: tRNA1(Val) (adenine(37)-N6)-methyltransferase [Candidatus Sericytochromatia bacterium]
MPSRVKPAPAEEVELSTPQDLFRLKQFSLSQAQAPIKVGTDALLLGAWSAALKLPQEVSQVLDIGTGTGILALMLAQRFVTDGLRPNIHALEIDPVAQALAALNFGSSAWASQLLLHPVSLQTFKPETMSSFNMSGFDLIVSNPPYFPPHRTSPLAARAQGRSQITLHWSEILAFAAQHLHRHGQLALILPVQAWPALLVEASSVGLSPIQLSWVAGHAGVPAKRLLSAWGRWPVSCSVERLCLRQGATPQSAYSVDYLALLEAYFPGFSTRTTQAIVLP